MKIMLDLSPKQIAEYSKRYDFDFWQLRTPLTVGAAPAYRRAIVNMESDRSILDEEINTASTESKTSECVALWTENDVARLLQDLRESLKADVENGQTAAVRTALSELIDVIEYDVETRKAIIR